MVLWALCSLRSTCQYFAMNAMDKSVVTTKILYISYGKFRS